MTTETTGTRTHCPTCGAKLARQDMSNCPYCSTPFALVEGKGHESGESPNRARLERLAEKDEARALAEWSPPESEEWFAALRRGRRGGWIVALGAAGIALRAGSLEEGRSLWTSPIVWVGAVAVVLGVALWVRARTERTRLTSAPLLKRAAIVLDRRSVTETRGNRGKTVYFFTLELADGSTGEFRYPGRGAGHDLLTSGVTGVAFTRGIELLAFQRVRA